MYSALKIPEHLSKIYKTTDNDAEMANLARVNIFIGPNNSGKSRFLRALFVNEKPDFKFRNIDLNKLNVAIENFVYNVGNIIPGRPGALKLSHLGLKETVFKFHTTEYLRSGVDLKPIYDEAAGFRQAPETLVNIFRNYGYSSLAGEADIRRYIQNFLLEIRGMDLENFDAELYKRSHYYIPTLRGLRGVSYDNNREEPNKYDGYKIRTIKDYFVGFVEMHEKVYTGLGLYDDVKRLLLGVSTEREKVKNFENFLGKTFFEGKEVSIIPHIDSNVVYVKIGDDDDRPIYDLGEGIQSIIVLTYPLFFNLGENLNFFFEEPDLFLHPGYQRIFLEILNDERFSTFQYFFTTHSNHFLDMTLDFSETSVYSFHRASKEQFSITNIKNADKDILHALGARNSSVFLSNCTIWVEGITDRIYIKKYLEILMNEKQKTNDKIYKEDIHYSFVEYGGNNITHWSFLEDEDENHPNINIEPLCGQLFLISDSDNASKTSKKFKRQEKLKEKLGDNFYCLKAKEIENLLNPHIIIETIKQFEKDDCDSIDFRKIISVGYKNKPLGSYIDTNVQKLSKKYGVKKGKSGTVANKVQFAKIASSKIAEWNDLSDEAKNIVELLNEFIAQNNK